MSIGPDEINRINSEARVGDIQRQLNFLKYNFDQLRADLNRLTTPPEIPYYCELEDFELKFSKDGDAGYNLPLWDERLTNGEWSQDGSYILEPMEKLTVKTGVYMGIPKGFYGMLDTRSGTSKAALDLLCRTIDSPYRGNIRLALINLNSEPVVIKNGLQIAQIIVKRYGEGKPKKCSSYEDFINTAGETDRMANGFNSTGGGIEI